MMVDTLLKALMENSHDCSIHFYRKGEVVDRWLLYLDGRIEAWRLCSLRREDDDEPYDTHAEMAKKIRRVAKELKADAVLIYPNSAEYVQM